MLLIYGPTQTGFDNLQVGKKEKIPGKKRKIKVRTRFGKAGLLVL